MWSMHFNYKSYKNNFKNKKNKNRFCPRNKRSCWKSGRRGGGEKNSPQTADVDVKASIFFFFLNTPNLMHFALQSAPYYKHRVFFDTVCPKANHSRSNSNIWTWQKWCKMGSRSHSNLFDKKGWGWGWGTAAWRTQRQRQKKKKGGGFFWKKADQIACVCASIFFAFWVERDVNGRVEKCTVSLEPCCWRRLFLTLTLIKNK